MDDPEAGMTQRQTKKSEFLEVRLPHPTKQAFMERCRADGRSASDAVRGFIDGYLAGPARRPAPGRTLRLIAAGAALMICGLAAAPSFAHAAVSSEFARLDLNHDGQVSLPEFDRTAGVQVSLAAPALGEPLRRQVLAAAFRQIDADRDGGINLAEYRRYRGV